MPLRTFLRRAHLFLACTVGLIFVLSGLTGSVIVFDHALDEQLNPRLLLVEHTAGEGRLSYQQLLERAQGYAGEDYYISGLQAPRRADSSQMFWLKRADGAEGTFELYLHPYTGDMLGMREYGTYFTSYIYMLHHTLLMGQTGKLILGYAGIGVLLMLFTGLYLWWPQNGQWRKAVTIKRGARKSRRLLDIHRVGGIYGLAVLCVSVFTGLSIIFSAFYASVTETASPVAPAPKAEVVQEAGRTGGLITLDNAIARATDALNGSAFSRLYLPQETGSKTWLLTFAHPDDPKKSHGYERLTLHPYTGEVMQIRRWPQASAGDRFLAWQFPLHSGEAFGLAGRLLVSFCGWLPLLLMVTGIWRWQRKRAQRMQAVESALAPARG